MRGETGIARRNDSATWRIVEDGVWMARVPSIVRLDGASSAWTSCAGAQLTSVWMGQGYVAAIIPAPTVSFVASSMRMNEPVARLRA